MTNTSVSNPLKVGINCSKNKKKEKTETFNCNQKNIQKYCFFVILGIFTKCTFTVILSIPNNNFGNGQ